MVGDLVADRSEHQALEPTEATRADDDQIGISGRVEQRS
jgi:hypothetical protein